MVRALAGRLTAGEIVRINLSHVDPALGAVRVHGPGPVRLVMLTGAARRAVMDYWRWRMATRGAGRCRRALLVGEGGRRVTEAQLAGVLAGGGGITSPGGAG